MSGGMSLRPAWTTALSCLERKQDPLSSWLHAGNCNDVKGWVWWKLKDSFWRGGKTVTQRVKGEQADRNFYFIH